jgi:SAM-dependent methyltransferase
MTDEPYAYEGTELEIFREARRWKRYWSNAIRPFVAGKVLEVGAGIGANSEYLAGQAVTRLDRIEPDARFAGALADTARVLRQRGVAVQDRIGTVKDIVPDERFDSILYIDVLEHIEDDAGEVCVAASRLAAGGHLVVLSPAFQWLYSPFDRAVGHHRRYTSSTLRALTPPTLEFVSARYLDAPGAMLSAGNRLLLRHTYAGKAQVLFWDRFVVPIAGVTDVLTNRIFGRSVVGVWRARG